MTIILYYVILYTDRKRKNYLKISVMLSLEKATAKADGGKKKMEIRKDWEHIGNTEKETKLFKILDRLSINWKNAGQGDFTPQHTLFNCIIKDNKNNYYNFTYQCNTRYTQPTETSLLSCLISDAFCYSDSIVGDDDDNIEEFSRMFGYDNNIKELLRAYKGCKETYYNIKKMLNDEEIEIIKEYLEEVGEV